MKVDPHLRARLEREEHLSLAEAHALDEALAAQSEIAGQISELADSEPSLAWRAKLNERLIAAAPAQRRRPVGLTFAAFGAGVATAALALWMMIPRTPTPGATVDEAALITAHQSAEFALDTYSSETGQSISAPQAEDLKPWTPDDLGAF